MDEKDRSGLNALFHADILVILSPQLDIKTPWFVVEADMCLESAAALLLSGAKMLTEVAAEGPRDGISQILELVFEELAHVANSPSGRRRLH